MTSKDELRELKEKLAAIEHERWADWQKYCHNVIRQTIQAGNSLEEVLERWDKQIATPYAALTEREQASDMEQVDRYWPLILNLLEGEKQKAQKNLLDIAIERLKNDEYYTLQAWIEDADEYLSRLATLNKEPNKGEDVDG